MEFSTKQNLEWNIGGVNGDRVRKKKRERERLQPSFSLHPSLLLYFYFVALARSLQSYSPAFHSVTLCSENPTGQFCKYGSWQWVWKDGTFPAHIQWWPLSLAPSLPLSGALTAAGVKSTGRNGGGGGVCVWGAGLFCHKSSQEGRGLWGATGEVWTHLPLIILPVRGLSLDPWTSELPHTTNLLINREIPWKNFEQPLCVRVHVCT